MATWSHIGWIFSAAGWGWDNPDWGNLGWSQGNPDLGWGNPGWGWGIPWPEILKDSVDGEGCGHPSMLQLPF